MSQVDTEAVKSLLRTCLVDIIISISRDDGQEPEEVEALLNRINNRIEWAVLE